MSGLSPDTPVLLRDIEVARPGTFKGLTGEVTLSLDDLARAVANYDPAHEECTTVIDHDKSGPSHGLWEAFRIKAGRMVGDLRTTLRVAQKMFRGGEYSRRSVWLSPNVPEREGYYPRHISLLGAKPPAIPGMAPIQPSQMVMLAASEDGEIELYCASDDEDLPKEALMAEVQTAHAAEVQLAEFEALQQRVEQLSIAIGEKEIQLAAQEALLADRAAKDAQLAALRAESNANKAARMVSERDPGNMPPAFKERATAVLSALLNGDGEVQLAGGDTQGLTDAVLGMVDAFSAVANFLPRTTETVQAAQGSEVKLSAAIEEQLARKRDEYGADSKVYKAIEAQAYRLAKEGR